MNTPEVAESGATPARRYVAVMQIPILGGNGRIQNRTLTFSRSPTKEFAINTLARLHEEQKHKDNYSDEWSRCADVLKQVPEELFSRMNQRRTSSLTCLVDVFMPGGEVANRVMISRLCQVHEVL